VPACDNGNYHALFGSQRENRMRHAIPLLFFASVCCGATTEPADIGVQPLESLRSVRIPKALANYMSALDLLKLACEASKLKLEPIGKFDQDQLKVANVVACFHDATAMDVIKVLLREAYVVPDMPTVLVQRADWQSSRILDRRGI